MTEAKTKGTEALHTLTLAAEIFLARPTETNKISLDWALEDFKEAIENVEVIRKSMMSPLT